MAVVLEVVCVSEELCDPFPCSDPGLMLLSLLGRDIPFSVSKHFLSSISLLSAELRAKSGMEEFLSLEKGRKAPPFLCLVLSKVRFGLTLLKPKSEVSLGDDVNNVVDCCFAASFVWLHSCADVIQFALSELLGGLFSELSGFACFIGMNSSSTGFCPVFAL